MSRTSELRTKLKSGNEADLNRRPDAIDEGKIIAISPPKFETIQVSLVGTAPYMQARFSEKARLMMRNKMLAGSQAKKGGAREARDFDDDYKQAMYLLPDGSHGLPAGTFRNACISACRIVGFKMTMAKLALFVERDGWDVRDGITPLVRIHGIPKPIEMMTRNATGVADIRVRPVWEPGWRIDLRISFDAEIFRRADVVNLLSRVGMQVGIGEGRPDSKASAGLGYGLFTVDNPKES